MYTFAFFIMVSAVALEIVFGVIVDSFKALREENEQKEKDITNKCFICGQSRNIFDSGPGGFQAHVKEEHNMWMYMYFLIHIREMEDKTELNGIESYVYGKVGSAVLVFVYASQSTAICTSTLFAAETFPARLSASCSTQFSSDDVSFTPSRFA